MNIVITGAAGYIGGHIALLLQDAGHTVVGIDRNLCPAHLEKTFDQFVQADFDSDESYRLLIDTQPETIIHCAGTSLVGPSITHPSDYYYNNVVKTLNLLNFMQSSLSCTRLIFSSSAAVYGEPIMNPCYEVDPREPVSPYGESKLMVEQMLASYHHAYGLEYVAFRYFNACGADPNGRHGQAPGATHIIARLLESVLNGSEFVLNGTSYPTDDGTCIRDYVHVDDIAQAHVQALTDQIPSGIYNLGTATGISNKQIIDTVREVTEQETVVSTGPARVGDPAMLTASAEKWNRVSGWVPKYNIQDMVRHAWQWYAR